jgi:alpha-beta hydrolase superfamily lysophospholipase
VNWRKTLDFQGEKRNVPPPIVDAAMVLSEKRAHLELDDFTQKSKASALTVPILLFHGEKDETVPLGPSKEFAEANPSKVQLELFPGATHTAEWNADSERYDRVLTQFLTPLAGQH